MDNGTIIDGCWVVTRDPVIVERIRRRTLRGRIDVRGRVLLHVEELSRLREENEMAASLERVMRSLMAAEFKDGNGLPVTDNAEWTRRFDAEVLRQMRAQFPGASDYELRGGR